METAAGKLSASVATMGLGASAGMEGASKWLGATIGSWLQKRLNRWKLRAVTGSVRTTLLAGGSAGIAAIFRAPLSGAIMGVESPYKHDLAFDALLPALVASSTSFWAYTRFRPATPYFPVHFHYTLSSRDLLIAVPLGLSAGLASHLFLWTLRHFRSWSEGLRVPLPVRTAIGGVLVAAIAFAAWRILGKPVTLQAGLPVANELLAGHYALPLCLVIFVLKLAATSVTFGAGGVGGLFVPTATIGAALGASWDALLSASHPGVYTLLGIAAFAGASYNSLLFAAVFIAEATGNVFLVAPALIASTLAFLVTAGVSNSRAQLPRREETLAQRPLATLMTAQPVTASPAQTLTDFAHALLLTHPYRALPVVDAEARYLGVMGLPQLRTVPMESWSATRVGDALDAGAPTLAPAQSAAEAERLLRAGPHGYLPVVDAERRLVGIVSASDLHRARKPKRDGDAR